jgi:hypothetical protein
VERKAEWRAQVERDPEIGGAAPATGKVMAAFRIPRQLHSTMTQARRASTSPPNVNRLFDGFLHYFGLQSSSARTSSATALGTSRYEYLQYVLYRRHEAVMEKGEAFDRAPKRK